MSRESLTSQSKTSFTVVACVTPTVCDPTGRFGDDIPGMEGLGTGELASGFLVVIPV